MTTKQIQQTILCLTGHKTTVSKLYGSMKIYTRFSVSGTKYGDLGPFDPKVNARLKALFPCLEGHSGYYIDLDTIDILNKYIEEEKPELFKVQLTIF